MDVMKVVAFAKIVVTTPRASTVISAKIDSIVHSKKVGMKPTSAKTVTAIISIQLEIVKKELVIVSADPNSRLPTVTNARKDILVSFFRKFDLFKQVSYFHFVMKHSQVIPTAGHANVISTEPWDTIVKRLTEYVHARSTLLAISAKNVHPDISTILNVNLVIVTKSVPLVTLAMKTLVSVFANRATVESIVINVRMDITTTRHVLIANVTIKELNPKSVTKLAVNVCVTMVMVAVAVIIVQAVFITILTVFPATVQRLEAFKPFATTKENVLAFKTLLANVAISA